MARGSRLNLDHRRKAKASCSRIEWIIRNQNERIAEGTKALLKAQLKAGNHTLTKESFDAVVKKYKWQHCLQPSLI